MFERAPNGFFVRDLILFNQLRRGGYVAKGFVFEAPDLTNSPIADLNDFQEQLCLLLASLHENQRLQVQYFSDSDYKAELLRYQSETERCDNPWTKRSRNERFARYWQAMTERKLRRQRVIFYVSRALENTPKLSADGAVLREYYLTLLDQLQTEFAHVHHLLKEIFSNTGTRILPMSDLDHFKHFKSFLNPSLADRFDFDAAQDFAPELSIQENCWHSEGNGQSDFGFYLDGHYHSVIALTRWPRTTYPGIIQRLTNLRLLDFSITVNIDPLPITREISKEEKEHDRVAGDYASEKKISLLTVMEKKQKKIHALMQGQTIPFHALFLIRVWDKSKDGLNAKASAIKNAINSMNSAQYFESNLPTTSRSLFFQTWPGWTWGRYEHRKLYAEHRYLADMLPVTSTFTGHLKTAEAIYDGPNNNLVGIETFSGSENNKSPQHAILLGMSGAGKSVSVCDLLSQTEGYFAYTVIIEEGLSYGIYTQTVEHGARPIIIHPDGNLTINYLDKRSAADAGSFVRRDRARRAHDWRFVPRGQANAPAGADRQVSESALRRFISGLAEDTSRPTTRHRPARNGASKISRRKNAARRDHPRNFCGLPRPGAAWTQWGTPGQTSSDAAMNFNEWGTQLPRPIPGSRSPAFPERPQDHARSPQSRLCLFHPGGISDAPNVAGIDDARSGRFGARADRRNRHAHPAVVP